MADSGIKKAVVLKSSLPALSGIGQEYVVRYRIVSEDKNRFSHWSPQYKLGLPNLEPIDYSVAVQSAFNTVTLVWDSVDDIKEYDVYIKWGAAEWKYATTIATTTYSTLIKSGETTVKLAVQKPTFPKNRFSGSTLFETPAQAL